MRKLFAHTMLSVSAALFIGLAAGNARADIIFLPNESAPKGGVGHTPESILSIQSPGNTTNAAGGVSYGCSQGKKGTTCSDVRSGDAKNGEHTKTLSFSDIGVTNAAGIRIFMDTEDPNNDLLLNDLVLTAYSSNGTILFQGSLVAPIFFPDEQNGQGKGDRVFGLTSDQAAQLQAAFLANPDLSWACSPAPATTPARSPTSSSDRGLQILSPSPNRRRCYCLALDWLESRPKCANVERTPTWIPTARASEATWIRP